MNIHRKGAGIMRNYATQMEAARKGIITPEMEAVAKKEYRATEEIRELVAKGRRLSVLISCTAVWSPTGWGPCCAPRST